MRIALDLDGPVYDFHRTFRYMMREHRGVVMPPVKDFWYTWDAAEKFGTTYDHLWMWTMGVERGLFRFGHMMTGCRIGLEALADAGHTLCIVTHRPANAVSDTLDWVTLMFEGLPLDGFYIMSNGESKATVEADVLIDDKIENVREWAQTGRQAILFDAPYNRNFDVTGVARANGWKEVVRVVNGL